MMARRDYWQRDFGRGPAWQQNGGREFADGGGFGHRLPPMARDGDGMRRDGGPIARGGGSMSRNGRMDGGDGNRSNTDVETRLDSIERRLDTLMRLISQEHDQQPRR